MKFTETPLSGAYKVELEPHYDERGFFARTWCTREFELRGLSSQLVQCSVSFNRKKGTLRGLHYQDIPHQEVKVVRCTAGAIYDVVIDLRPSSATYKCWFAVELSAINRSMLYIPSHFAHGFQTLQDDTEVFYQMSEFYHPESARGLKWNDPAFQIKWPLTEVIISSRDRAHPDFTG